MASPLRPKGPQIFPGAGRAGVALENLYITCDLSFFKIYFVSYNLVYFLFLLYFIILLESFLLFLLFLRCSCV